jgi:DNA-binding transcriptional regulator YiaG
VSQIPSPAGERQHNGLPWESALYEAVRALEGRAVRAERERDEMALSNQQLRAKLAACRERLQNWELRRQAWTRERRTLLGQLEQAQERRD